jgi:HlyD family secretion protein
VKVDEEGRYVPDDPEEGPKAAKDKARADAPVVRDTEKKEELEGVFLRGEDLRARFRPVRTGITGEMDIELVEGLEAGDEILVGPFKVLRTISEGDRIRVDNRGFEGFSRREKE